MGVRFLVAIPIAALVTTALFLLMRQLITAPSDMLKGSERIAISFTRRIEDTESRPRERNLEPPDIQEPASQAPRPDQELLLRQMDINTEIENPDGPPLPRGFAGGKPGLHNLDGSASVLVRAKPAYPPCGRGVGEVVLEFVVESDGSVGLLSVVNATSSCFARAAERAALRWRYRPKVVDGKAVRSGRKRVTIIFIPE